MTTKLQLPDGFERRGNRITKTPQATGDAAPAPAPAPAPPAEPAAAGMTCPECGATVKEGDKYCAQCGAKLGEKDSGAPDGSEARALARHVVSLTESPSPEAARGVLAAWKESHGKVAELAAAKGHLEREQFLERAVAEGKLTPAEAWTFTVNDKGEKVRSFSAWAGPPQADGTGQTLAQLKAFAGTRASAPAPFTPAKVPKTESGEPLSEWQRARAKQLGMAEAEYAAELGKGK